jgi:Skp family chaperone for outer membrane proteins
MRKEIVLDEKRCKQTVIPNDKWGSFHPHQCNRAVVKDGFCKQHHPDAKAERNAASMERWRREKEYQNRTSYFRVSQEIRALIDKLNIGVPMLEKEVAEALEDILSAKSIK